MHKILVLLLLLCSCTNTLTEEDVRVREYGELYATMTCWWTAQENFAPTIFWCTETLETELISGYVSLAIEEDLAGERFFSICGRDIVLNTGYPLHDAVIPAMTEFYNCLNSYERNLGDEFDWLWDDKESTLQLIWRPDRHPHKVLTLFVEEQQESPWVTGRVYYKTGYFN